MNKSTVLFFDSGMGGLSVYREAKKLMPDNHYLYCFDNAGFPYSEKSEETIIQRTLDICKKINQDYPLDAIVIACNTASTVVLPHFRHSNKFLDYLANDGLNFLPHPDISLLML